MSLPRQELNSVIPDLRDLPLERLAELGDSALAESIDLYRRRLKETGVPLNSFTSSILGTPGPGSAGRSALVTTHSLSADAFLQLAGGAGDRAVVGQVRNAQLSKHLMLLRVVSEAAGRVHPPSPATAAFRAGYRLLAEVQAVDPGVAEWQLRLPHTGSWAHDCVARLDEGSAPDFGYLAAAAAAAAIRLGRPFEIDVPVWTGRVLLPGLGCLKAVGQGEWMRLSSDGERLRAGEHIDVACAGLVPDDGSGGTVPHWQGTPLIRATADGHAWELLLETADRHLDRYTLPMLTDMTAAEDATWRRRIQSAWELLVRQHEWAAGPIADGVSVIVPLVPRSDLDSAASPAAFGAIAMSVPPSPVSMAETLVHEFQHLKLCGLMDMMPLIEPSGEKGYAPWREDPRPMGGLLQGVYAFAGIVRFWDSQRKIETEPDDVLHANVVYERWRSTIELVTGALLGKGILTPTGGRFVTELRDRERDRKSELVPAEAAEVASEVALDNWLTWQLRHTALDAEGVTGLAAAFQRGEPLGDRALPRTWIEDDIRKIDSVVRSRLLHMRYQQPQRYRQLSAADHSELDAADALLVRGEATAAVSAYRERLTAEPDPAAWIGLALAIHRIPEMPSRTAFARGLPLMYELHVSLADMGINADPLDLVAWFA